MNIAPIGAPAANVTSSIGRCHASRVAGRSARRAPWLWVAAMPAPSHSAVTVNASNDASGNPVVSMKYTPGASSPSTIAVVIM